MVPPRGIAPRSSAYRADALLLSYGGFEKWSRTPVLPRVPPRSKRGGFADSLVREKMRSWIVDRPSGSKRNLLSRRNLDLRSTILDPVNGCGGRNRTGDARRMRPLPYHLATPLLWEKLARRPGAAPDSQGFGNLAAQADARRFV